MEYGPEVDPRHAHRLGRREVLRRAPCAVPETTTVTPVTSEGATYTWKLPQPRSTKASWSWKGTPTRRSGRRKGNCTSTRRVRPFPPTPTGRRRSGNGTMRGASMACRCAVQPGEECRMGRAAIAQWAEHDLPEGHDSGVPVFERTPAFGRDLDLVGGLRCLLARGVPLAFGFEANSSSRACSRL